jgi:hypothetical protein
LVEQSLGRSSSANGYGDPNARGDSFTVRDAIRATIQVGDKSCPNIHGVRVAIEVGCEDDKLVAADAGNNVHWSDGRD